MVFKYLMPITCCLACIVLYHFRSHIYSGPALTTHIRDPQGLRIWTEQLAYLSTPNLGVTPFFSSSLLHSDIFIESTEECPWVFTACLVYHLIITEKECNLLCCRNIFWKYYSESRRGTKIPALPRLTEGLSPNKQALSTIFIYRVHLQLV